MKAGLLLFLNGYLPAAVLGIGLAAACSNCGEVVRMAIPIVGPVALIPAVRDPFTLLDILLVVDSAVQLAGALLIVTTLARDDTDTKSDDRPLALQLVPIAGGAYGSVHVRF